MPLSKLTTRLVSFVLMFGLFIVIFVEGVEAKREKSEQKWRSCWVRSGGERERVICR